MLAPVLAKEFELGSLGKAMVIAAGFAGMFIGANVLSVAADRLGRRRVFILNLLVYSLFSFAAAFSPNIETFIVLRVIAGASRGDGGGARRRDGLSDRRSPGQCGALSARRSPASIRTGRRFSAGVSGQENRGE